MATRYVSPTGSGTGDGSSWANAATLQQISDQIASAGAGGQVLLRADQGAYNLGAAIDLHAGGADGAAVTIRGVDTSGAAMAAQIVGTRSETWTQADPKGPDAFDLSAGADHLRFTDLAFKNLGDGAFHVNSAISDLQVDKVSATNLSTFLMGYNADTGTGAAIHGLSVSNVNITAYSRTAISLGFDTSDVTIENVFGDAQRRHSGNFVTGVNLNGAVHDVVLRNVTMNNNFGQGTADRYWNGDGFVTERGVYNVVFENTVANGNTDAGYDLKSSNTLLLNAYAEDNKRNYRIWSDITIQDSTSVNPNKFGGTGNVDHIWLRTGADVYLNNFHVVDTAGLKQLAELEAGDARLYINDSAIPADYASHMTVGTGSRVIFNTGPTGVAISNAQVFETAAAGAVVGKVSAVDVDANDPHTFSIVGVSSDFELVGDEVRVKAGAVLDHDQHPTEALTIRVVDQGLVAFDQALQIAILDAPATTGVTITGTAGADLIDASHTVAGQPLPTAQADTINGGGGADTISALGGNDTISGGSGADLMRGGPGDDTYIVDHTGDQVVELAGEGTDLVKASVTFTLAAGVENLTLTGNSGISGVGNALDNALLGNPVANTLTGGDGNDRIDGGGGADRMVGGNGDDTYVMDRATDVVVETAGGGIDTVRTATNVTLAANVENLIATGTSSQTLTGNASANTLTGNAAANMLDGLGGADTMVGGAGNDTYVVDSMGDVIVELANQGVDTVRTTLGAYTLGANLENLTQLGATPFTGAGNSLANTIVGGSGADILDGRGGADSLKGGAGADRFVLRAGETNNDVVQDFTGAGAAAGDSLSFQGFGQGTITKVAGQTDLYRVAAEVGGASEVFRLLGVTDLDVHAGAGHNDVFFV